MKAAAIVQERRDHLATLLTTEQGKPLPDAAKRSTARRQTLRFYAEEAKRIGGDIAPPNAPNARSLVIRQPLGVVVAIVPWNYPVSLLAWKIAPALAAELHRRRQPSLRNTAGRPRICGGDYRRGIAQRLAQRGDGDQRRSRPGLGT